MPHFEVTITETRTYKAKIEADSHLDAEQRIASMRDLEVPLDVHLKLTAKDLHPELPLQFADRHPTVDSRFEHLLGDSIQPNDLVKAPSGFDRDGRAYPFVLAKTTDRVGYVITSHDTVLRYHGGGAFPSYPKDAIEATGYGANPHLRECISITAGYVIAEVSEAVKFMFVVVSSKSQISAFDEKGKALIENSDDLFATCYLSIIDLPFLPCVIVNPGLREASRATKAKVQAVWEKMSPAWFELT